ncbi:hypothetical protein B0H34DRAFT_674236 [Crassisporium funariophilum]|nr:hypothetical protein B0H34DRAFT_674236 [Crassisporium funariophilum]
MTRMDIPAGTIGNTVPVELQNFDPITSSDTTLGQTSNSSTDLPVVPPEPPIDAKVEADKVRTRNAERRALQDAGVTDISDNEEETGPMGGQQPAVQVVPEDHHTAFLAAWSLMTNDQRNKVFDVIGPKAVPKPSAVKPKSTASDLIFLEERELLPVTTVGAHKFGICPEIRKLAAAGLHVPISLFLARSMRDIFLKSIPKEQHIIGNTKTYLIKVNNFPDDNSMDPTDCFVGGFPQMEKPLPIFIWSGRSPTELLSDLQIRYQTASSICCSADVIQ